MEEQVVHLKYPPSLVKMPVINDLIRNYQSLQVNILRGEVAPDYGWFEIQFVGNPAVIQDAINWLQDKGIEVETVGN